MSIAVTGASGHLGRATAELLLAQTDPASVVLITRDPSKLDDLADRGATVRRGDFDDPASMREALTGVERMLLVSTDAIGRRVAQHTAAIEAARDAGVGHVLYTSIVNPVESNPAGVVPEHIATETAMRDSGLAWTMLRNGLYAEFEAAALGAAIDIGSRVHNRGDGVSAFVSRDDCAAVAAAVLTSDGHEGKAYDVTGPEELAASDEAQIASELSGTTVQNVPVDDDAFAAGLVEHAGLPPEVATLVATFGRAIREGRLAGRSTIVEDLTGRPARSLREIMNAG